MNNKTERPATALRPAIALIGNPNVGKTTLFNELTGLSQHVGNYPGVTVEKKTGTMNVNGESFEIIDLPGTYSLSAHSPDEAIAVNVLLGQQADTPLVQAAVVILDASNLERNMYLLTQTLECGLPVIAALNMLDVAEAREYKINAALLNERLGIPVIPLQANKRVGIPELKDALVSAVKRNQPAAPDLTFPKEYDDGLEALRAAIAKRAPDMRPPKRASLQRILIDRGGMAEQRILGIVGADLLDELEVIRVKTAGDFPLPALEAKERYRWIKIKLDGVVVKPDHQVPTLSDKIDKVITHKVWGTLVFIIVMFVMFQAVFRWAEPAMVLIDAFFGWISDGIGARMADGALKSLIIDGAIAGVGGVVIFLPQILFLFLFIALLEDCGYMPRAAMLMDKLMTWCGLSGRSFVPMLSSFACSVPGVMATRTIENRRDRIATMLVAPLMSCSARMPVYVVFISAVIPLEYKGLTLFTMYIIGILFAIPIAWILKKTLLRGETPAFLMEMPSYKIPQMKSVVIRLWEKAGEFLVKAGTIIFAMTIVVWALLYFPRSEQSADGRAVSENNADGSGKARAAEIQIRNSILGRIGIAIEPVFRPMGWDWKLGVAAIASFPAREIVVSTLGTLYSLGSDQDEESEPLRDQLRNDVDVRTGKKIITIPTALSVMVFFALCMQCGATVAAIRRESNSWGWAVFAFAYSTTLAYVMAMITYQTANALLN
ncbi:MAG: ferrous iron transport protein B [Planctomycetota bacterium]